MLSRYGLIMIIAQFINAISQIILKTSANQTKNLIIIKKFLNVKVFIAYCLFMLEIVINLIAYRGVDFKYGGIIQSIGQVFVVILSVIILSEKLNLYQIFGNIIVLFGVVIYNLR